MATRKRGRPVHRSATRGRSKPPNRPHQPEDQALAGELRRALRGGPLEMTVLVSTMIDVLQNPGSDEAAPAPTLEQLVESLVGIPIAETTAALHIIAALSPGDLLGARIRRELATRSHPMPLDVAGAGDLRIAQASRLQVPFDVGNNYFLELAGPGVREFTMLVYVDHRHGTLVKDAFLMGESLAKAEQHFRDVGLRDGFETEIVELDLADVRATLEAAVAAYAHKVDLLEPSDTWPALRPLLNALLRHLPTGGSIESHEGAYAVIDLGALDDDEDDDGAAEMADAIEEAEELALLFLNSPDALRGLGDDPADGELAHLFAMAAALLPGAEYRWLPSRITDFLRRDLPVAMPTDPDAYARAPHLFRAFVRFCHDWDEIEEAATAEALAAIDRGTEAFLATLHDPEIARQRELHREHVEDTFYQQVLELRENVLIAAVGSHEALSSLDTQPLPDETLALGDVATDVRERVAEVSALVDRTVAGLFDDAELRTAARRILARVAARDPAIFRRRSKDETAAAAIIWITARANLAIGPGTSVTVGELMSALGLRGSPSQRAQPMLAAIGAQDYGYGPLTLGDPNFLTAHTRADILAAWDELG